MGHSLLRNNFDLFLTRKDIHGARHSAPAVTAEKVAKRKIRRKLGHHGQLRAAKYPPKPRSMWRRTYARHCAALSRIEHKLGY